MEHLIQLQSSIATLTNDELVSLIQSFGREYLTTILYNHFYHSFNKSQSQSEFHNTISNIRTINDKISEIISLRKSNSIENELELELQPLQIDELPLIMISKISSFLQFNDLKSFELCNRSIFIGTRSPISLYQLQPTYATKLITYLKDDSSKNSYFHWHRFKLLRKFKLRIEDYLLEVEAENDDHVDYVYSLNNIPFWNKLKTLTISEKLEESEWEDYSDMYMDQSGVKKFFSDLITLNLSNLTFLKNELSYMPKQYLQTLLLNTNESLQFIYFGDQPFNQLCDIIPNEISGIGSNINSYDDDDDEINLQISIPENVESLHLSSYEILHNSGIKLENVKEICMGYYWIKDIQFFNSHKLKYLQRIHIDFPVQCVFPEQCSCPDKHDFLNNAKPMQILVMKQMVSYISIRMYNSDLFIKVMNFWNNVFKNISKKTIKIRITCFNRTVNCNDLNQVILALVKTLQKNNDQFMVIGSVSVGKKISKDVNFDALNFTNYSTIESITQIVGDHLRFVIKNVGCTMNGYQENWLMQCHSCNQLCYDSLYNPYNCFW
eukprot:126913_1